MKFFDFFKGRRAAKAAQKPSPEVDSWKTLADGYKAVIVERNEEIERLKKIAAKAIDDRAIVSRQVEKLVQEKRELQNVNDDLGTALDKIGQALKEAGQGVDLVCSE